MDEFVTVHNDSEVPTSEVYRALVEQHPETAALVRWGSNYITAVQNPNRAGGMVDRDKYTAPKDLYSEFVVAQYAAENDDVISNVLDSTESLAFSKMQFSCEDPDQEDVWNQWAAEVDLDSRMREMWRELFTVSQVYVSLWWSKRTYKVRGKTKNKNQKRKSFDVRVPTAMTILDPLKIVPIGMNLFGQERLGWIATREEAQIFDRVIQNPALDKVIANIVERPYLPSNRDDPLYRQEMKRLQEAGFHQTGSSIYLLREETTFRHTATKPGYLMWAQPRLRSTFELLDLKRQLRENDRTMLVAGTHFIVLIKKGSDQRPATSAEIANLQGGVQTLSKQPVIVGDHRLSVEIVTPKMDQTLKSERHDLLDVRIAQRLYQMLVTGSGTAGTKTDDSVKLMKVIARGMESRRHMLRRTLEAKVFKPIYDKNEVLDEQASLEFHPRQIALDFDAAFASFLLELRGANEISRETILGQFDMDQADEARRLEREKAVYDDIFQTQVPFSTPNPKNQGPNAPVPPVESPRQAGRTKGGAAPGSGQGQPPRSATKRSGGQVRQKVAQTAAVDTDPEDVDTSEEED